MPASKARKFIPRRRVVALLASGLLLAACGGEEKKSGTFKMHKTIGDGPGM
jgi:ABC-type glycerol-3-phosphate transport system substrate-binding protein